VEIAKRKCQLFKVSDIFLLVIVNILAVVAHHAHELYEFDVNIVIEIDEFDHIVTFF